MTQPDISERINRTPRTDANARDGWSGDAACVSVEFAGQLEDELALATTAMAEKDAEIARLRAACKAAVDVLPGLEVRSWPPGHEMKRKAIQQLQTALGETNTGETT
jgi:hypothetical protein